MKIPHTEISQSELGFESLAEIAQPIPSSCTNTDCFSPWAPAGAKKNNNKLQELLSNQFIFWPLFVHFSLFTTAARRGAGSGSPDWTQAWASASALPSRLTREACPPRHWAISRYLGILTSPTQVGEIVWVRQSRATIMERDLNGLTWT